MTPIVFCPACRQHKPRDQFYKCRTRPNGLTAACAACEFKRLRERNLSNQAINYSRYSLIDPYMTYQCCRTCDEVKPLSEYHRRANRPMGWAPSCKDCVNLMQRTQRRIKSAPRRALRIVAHYV